MTGATSHAPPGLIEAALAALEGLIGLAPSDIARRRLARHGALLERAMAAAASLDNPHWAEVVDLVTVQETRLFRNPTQLTALRAAVLPTLAAAARNRGRLRLLSAGCATGEEAWTLAALAREAADAALEVEVAGLDLSRPALATAEAARYRAGPPDPLRDTPADFHHLFPQRNGLITVAGPLRRTVRFRRANLLAPDEAAGGFDVVLFRNVGIYLTDAARQRTGAALAALLRPGGALLLGPTDAAPRDSGLVPWDGDSVSIHRREGRSDDDA